MRYIVVNIDTNDVNDISIFLNTIKYYQSLFNPNDKFILKIFKTKNKILNEFLIKRFDLIKDNFDKIKKQTINFINEIIKKLNEKKYLKKNLVNDISLNEKKFSK